MVSILEKLRKHKGVSGDREEGNSLVLYLLMIPVVFSFFGLAVDATIATYTQTSLQSNLDAALQSTLSRATNPGGAGNAAVKPTFPPGTINRLVNEIYDQNRKGNGEQPFVICQTSPIKSSSGFGSTLVVPDSGCGWTQGFFAYGNNNNELRLMVSITEQSKPVFLQFLDIEVFTYNIQSQARTNYAIR